MVNSNVSHVTVILLYLCVVCVFPLSDTTAFNGEL